MKMKLYDKEKIDWKNLIFDNKALFTLLFPIIIEQLLNSFMGMADTMMVSTVGSEAISAVSLVDSLNNLVIQIFAAMAAGAAIICSQYLGSGNKQAANKTGGAYSTCHFAWINDYLSDRQGESVVAYLWKCRAGSHG